MKQFLGMINIKKERQAFEQAQNRDQQISSILREYDKQNGYSITEFCKVHKIHKSTFYYWRKRYANKNIVADKPKGFLPLVVANSSYGPSSDAPTLFAEFKGIRIYHFVSADYLKTLLS